ncbi:MAG TPA: hypothetical protein VMH87_10865, partial [Pseudomonadales bacterium]|nr:hypothetical protein [Pseudomonadales bacterium]
IGNHPRRPGRGLDLAGDQTVRETGVNRHWTKVYTQYKLPTMSLLYLGIPIAFLAWRRRKIAKLREKVVWMILLYSVGAAIVWHDPLFFVFTTISFAFFLWAYWWTCRFVKRFASMPLEEQQSSFQKFPPFVQNFLDHELKR